MSMENHQTAQITKQNKNHSNSESHPLRRQQEITDIDNLPIYTTEAPVLSMDTLRKSASFGKSQQHKDNDDKNPKKKKYSSFFVKNFFLAKHNESNQTNGKYAHTQNDDEEEKSLHRIKMRGNYKEKAMNDLRLSQQICSAHKGAIYCMEFSKKGDYLASGGQDAVLRLWTVCGSRVDAKRWKQRTKKTENDDSSPNNNHKHKAKEIYFQTDDNVNDIISNVAYREFTGHRADIIDISWSNGEFVLSASIDQTVMLWHTSRSRCLCLFQHSDIVTSVHFHPNEDYLFLSGSFDSRLRLWNILEHRVIDWVQVPTLVTSTTFSNNGKFAIAGLYDGQCFFYSTQGHRLKYVTAIECRNHSGKYRKGRKVTGLSYLSSNNENGKGKSNDANNELLISTNDSRLRLYNLSNFAMKCKYKGHENTQSQIHARLSPDNKLIISGSEDGYIFIWRVEKMKNKNDERKRRGSLFHNAKSKTRQENWEYFKSNSKLPQVALFAPHRTVHYVHRYRMESNMVFRNNEDKIKHIVLTADTDGHINIYTNHSRDKNYKYPHNVHGTHSSTRKKKSPK